MKKDWNISDCGLLKREETEPTFWKFSGCTKVSQPLHSATSLFCKLLLAPEDIIAKLVKNRCRLDLRQHFFSERVVDRWNGLDQCVIDSACLLYTSPSPRD